MSDSVKEQEIASPEKKEQSQEVSNKELNFRRLEAEREKEREARLRAEMQNEMLRKEMDTIKEMLKPVEKDPLDEVEDFVDPARLKAKLQKERDAFIKEAEAIANKTYETRKRQEEQENYESRLRSEYNDYNQIMTPENLDRLQVTDPVFAEAILRIPDKYEQRRLAYQHLKKVNVQKQEDKPSIKEKVEENLTNPYYIPPGSGSSTGAIDFDVRSKSARISAYEKLKAAQRRPIGGNQIVKS